METPFPFHVFAPIFQDVDRSYAWVEVLLFIALTAGLLYLLRNLAAWSGKPDHKETKWLVFLVLLLLPLSFLGRVNITDALVLTANGTAVQPILFLFALIPVTLGVGTVGLIPNIVVAIATGLLHSLLFNQDPLLGLVYAFIAIGFACMLRMSGQKKGDYKAFILPVLGLTGLLFLGVILIQYAHGLAFALHGLRPIFKGAWTQFLVLLPAIVIASMAAIFISRQLKGEWTPEKYILPEDHDADLKTLLAAVEAITDGNYEAATISKSMSRSSRNLAEALEVMKISLRSRSDAQNRLLSVDPAHYSKEAYDLVLGNVLRAAMGRDASSARLVLISMADEDSKPEMRLRMGRGDLTGVYAYLDVMILDKLFGQERLVFSDLKVDQVFGLGSGVPYPQSLIAVPIRNENLLQGLLWVGFEKTVWFNPEDIRFYEQLALRAAAVLNTKEQISRVQTEKEWLSAGLDSWPEPIFLLDKSGRILFSNYAGQALAKANPTLVHVNREKQVFTEPKISSMLTRNMMQPEILGLADGKEYEVQIHRIRGQEEPKGSMLLFKDTAWLKRINAQKSEMVTDISHDLRAPLSMVKGYLRLVTKLGPLTSEQEKFIARSQASIENMTRLVNKVMSLERLDDSETIQYTTFDIQEVLDETISLLSLQAQQRKVTMNVDTGGMQSAYIRADRVLMQQAIFNLVENAVKFSPHGETILVTASKDNHGFHLSVQDHGKGIAPLDQPKIFTRFFHIDDDDALTSHGHGLGLSIVKSIAERHGGSIHLVSQLGEGSTFTLHIPQSIRN